MSNLPTNYVDDVLNQSVNTQRRFVIKDTATGEIINSDVVIEEITEFETQGSNMGAQVINQTNGAVNDLSANLTATYDKNTGKWYEINSNGTRGDEIKMGIRLDLKKPVHAFTTSEPSGLPAEATYGLTFTATETCYLSGGMYGGYSNQRVLKINGLPYAHSGIPINANGANAIYIDCLELSEGDVIEINKDSYLYIYKLKED